MKKNVFVILLALTIGILMLGCNNDSTETESTDENELQVSYVFNDYEITIMKKGTSNRAVYKPVSGDDYVLKKANIRRSYGTIAISGDTYTFSPKSGKPPFTAKLDSGVFDSFSEIVLDDGTIVNITGEMSWGVTGTWEFGGLTIIVEGTFESGTWSSSGAGFVDDYGTHSGSGNVASIFSTKFNLHYGSGTYVDYETIILNFNTASAIPGRHTMKRVQ